jgi:hypothetical protein
MGPLPSLTAAKRPPPPPSPARARATAGPILVGLGGVPQDCLEGIFNELGFTDECYANELAQLLEVDVRMGVWSCFIGAFLSTYLLACCAV